MTETRIPGNPLEFICRCVKQRRVLWTYHVHMRLRNRSISRAEIFESVGTYEIIESYPDDKYLPSYLVWSRHHDEVMHILFATDVNSDHVRIVTVYHPTPSEWSDDYKRRRKS